MRRAIDQRGFGSLVAIGAVLLVSGLLLAWTSPYLYRVQAERRMSESWEAKRSLEKVAAGILADIERETRGETEGMLRYSLPANVRLEDASAKLNLNWARKYLLQGSPLIALFKSGNPDDLQAFRATTPLGTDLTAYEAFFDPGDLERYFCIDSAMNPNCVDEFAFENVMAQATGDSSSGTAWREKLRQLRLDKKLIKGEAELRMWFGADWDRVALFASSFPEMNANTLDPFLLSAMLSCTDFHIPEGAGKAGAIVATRTGRYLSDADLRTMLGVPVDNPIWAHLGSKSSRWHLMVEGEAGLVLDLRFQLRDETESGSVFRVLERKWSHV